MTMLIMKMTRLPLGGVPVTLNKVISFWERNLSIFALGLAVMMGAIAFQIEQKHGIDYSLGSITDMLINFTPLIIATLVPTYLISLFLFEYFIIRTVSVGLICTEWAYVGFSGLDASWLRSWTANSEISENLTLAAFAAQIALVLLVLYIVDKVMTSNGPSPRQ